MARPTKEEQERRRIAGLLSEGKGPDGQVIDDATILSETKNPNPAPSGGFTIQDLESEITNSTLGTGLGEEKKDNSFDMQSGDASASDTDDPNYVKPSGHDRFRDEMIVNESDANKAATGNPGAINTGNGNPLTPPPPPVTDIDFAEPIINGASPTADAEKKDDKKPLNPELDDLSPTERRRQTELFADAILQTYGQLYHAAFSNYCSVNMGKMEILDKDGNIRLSMVIDRDDDGEMTIRKHLTKYNERVDEIFTISDEQKLQLREPLIAVLMEKGIAPTPMVTLLVVFGSHLLQGVMATAQLKAEMRDSMETFKTFRKAELVAELDKHKTDQYSGPPVNNHQPQQQQQTSQESGKIVSMDDAISKVEIKSTPSTIIPFTQPLSNGNNITIDEVIPTV